MNKVRHYFDRIAGYFSIAWHLARTGLTQTHSQNSSITPSSTEDIRHHTSPLVMQVDDPLPITLSPAQRISRDVLSLFVQEKGLTDRISAIVQEIHLSKFDGFYEPIILDYDQGGSCIEIGPLGEEGLPYSFCLTPKGAFYGHWLMSRNNLPVRNPRLLTECERVLEIVTRHDPEFGRKLNVHSPS